MSWHDSHGGKWSKTFCITLCMGSRKPWRHMERGGLVSAALRCRGSPPWDQLTRLVACLDLLSSSWWNKILLSCPCHISYSRARCSAELPELLVLSVSLPAGLVAVGLVSTLCRDPGAAVPRPAWLLMVRGTFCGSQFLQWGGCLEFLLIKSGQTCAVSLPPGSEGVFWRNEQQWDGDNIHSLAQATTVKILW